MPTPVEMALTQLKRSGRRHRLPRASGNLSAPRRVEREYAADIRRMLDFLREDLRRRLIPELPGLVAEASAVIPQAAQDAIRMDLSPALKVAQLLLATRAAFSVRFPEGEIDAIIRREAEKIDAANKAALGALFTRVLGVNLITDEPHLGTILENHVADNVALIRNVTTEFMAKVEQQVYSGFRRGLRHEVIARNILGSDTDQELATPWSSATRRAKVIGRDQVNKLNGQLTEFRQKSAGLSRYRWRTVGDDRVREEHAKCEGHIFEWGKPVAVDGSDVVKPRGGLEPGQDVLCRCYAEPVFEGIVD